MSTTISMSQILTDYYDKETSDARFMAIGSTTGGGDTPFYKDYIIITSSTTWVAPYDCTVTLHAIGAGGGGASIATSSGSAGGGGGGGYVRKTVSLSEGDTLVCTIGAAGMNNQPKGGDTTITGPGVDILAGGGLAGTGSTTSGSSIGGAGGVASGGDINNAGGNGGRAVTTGSGGGGGVRFYSTGGHAADVLTASAGNGGGIHILNRPVDSQTMNVWPPIMGIYVTIGPFGPPTASQPLNGVGVGGLSSTGSTNYQTINGGAFAGGGGRFNTSAATGGAGGIGGGGGGGYTTGGAGGPGMIVIGVH